VWRKKSLRRPRLRDWRRSCATEPANERGEIKAERPNPAARRTTVNSITKSRRPRVIR